MKAILILFLFPLKIIAQDITGVWTGTLYNDSTRRFVPYEITISEEKGKLSGYSHTTWKPDEVDAFVNIGVKAIKIKRKNDKLYIEDEKWIYNNYNEPPPKGVKVYSLLSIQTGDSGVILSGPFNTNRTKEYAPATGSIRLTKNNNYAATKIIPKLEELSLANTLTFLPPKTVEKEVAVADRVVAKPQLLPPASKENEKAVTYSDPDSPKTKVNEPISTPNKNQSLQKEKEIVASVQKVETKVPENLPKQKEVVIAPSQKPAVKQPVISPPVSKQQVVSAPKPVVKPAVPAPKPKEVVKIPPPEIKKPSVVAAAPKETVPAPVSNILPKIIPVSAADLATRKIETIRSVNVKTDSLVINLYDNGEIDGDTVSVVLNGKTIMSRQGLTANAITKTIYLTPDMGDSLQLIMYAENLGSIPPNTGLLILQDGNDRYEIRFAGDLQKNSAIILRRNRK
jgi:hypothetical protein